jgi:hypothetical protein
VAVLSQQVTDRYALYNGDCVEVMKAMPAESIHLSVYSPPFAGLYIYSSSERDLSNSGSYDEFFRHYEYVVSELARVTMPGRMTAVHCMDVPNSNTGKGDTLRDFPGDIIRMHDRLGVASADYLLVFRRAGVNPVPIAHPTGLMEYAGERQVPHELLRYRGWTGNQIENRYSHWVWRQYASAFWDDVRLDRVLPFRPAREDEDEKHVHPLQLDVIDRALVLWSNPGETVLTPFMGVGSEVYSAVRNGRRGIGAELKPSYYRQAVKNLAAVDTDGVEQSWLDQVDEPDEALSLA